MFTTIYNNLTDKPRANSGFAALIILLIAGAIGIASLGIATISSNSQTVSQANIAKVIQDSPTHLDKYKLLGAKFVGSVLGSVSLPTGDFSSFEIVEAEVADDGSGAYIRDVKFKLPSGETLISDQISNIISGFSLKDGTVVPEAVIVDRMFALLELHTILSG